jgi:hypothetical protein
MIAPAILHLKDHHWPAEGLHVKAKELAHIVSYIMSGCVGNRLLNHIESRTFNFMMVFPGPETAMLIHCIS